MWSFTLRKEHKSFICLMLTWCVMMYYIVDSIKAMQATDSRWLKKVPRSFEPKKAEMSEIQHKYGRKKLYILGWKPNKKKSHWTDMEDNSNSMYHRDTGCENKMVLDRAQEWWCYVSLTREFSLHITINCSSKALQQRIKKGDCCKTYSWKS